jgi:diguanylate cyclase (GGDEF)-like protein/PAS domain S-box-containing protein
VPVPDRLLRLRFRRRDPLLGLCYFVAAALPAALARFGNGVAFIWIANALLLAVLHCRPRRRWLEPIAWCAGASFLATALFGMGPAAAGPLALINMAEAVCGALLLRRFAGRDVTLSTGYEIAVLVAAGLIGAALTGFAGAAVAFFCAHGGYWPNWLAWTSGHGLGALIITPVALLVLRGDAGGWARTSSPRDLAVAASLFLVLAAAICLVFAQDRYPLLFLPFLPLMACVFRFGRLGAAAGLLLLTVLSAAFAMQGLGPFDLIPGGAGVRAEFLQLYLAVATLTALPAAAELKRRHRLFAELQRNAAIHRVIVDRTGDLLMVTGLDGVIQYVSPSVAALSGFTPDQVTGRPARDLILPEDHERVIAAHMQALAAPETTVMVEYRAHKASGAIGWFESHIHAMTDDADHVTGAVTIVREVSRRKARESDLVAAASTDPLTGLPNRRAFESAFAALGRTALPGSPLGCVAMFDLDHFKRINDAHGHAAGDEVLKAFAAILSRSVRGQDVVARLGGEEFGAILAGATAEQAQAVCERIRRALASVTLNAPDGAPLHPTVSAGLSEIRPAASLEITLMAADHALYEAKHQGRNRLVFA